MLAACLTLPIGAADGRTTAARQYQHARTLLEDLRAVPRLELGRKQYDLVIEAFDAVTRLHPASGYSDDALLAVAQLYGEKYDRFGEDRYRNEAVAGYRFLIREYPHSKLLGQARKELAQLESAAPVTLTKAAPAARPKPEAPVEPERRPEPPPAAVVAKAAAPAETASSAPVSAEPQMRQVSLTQGNAGPGNQENRATPSPRKLRSGDATIKDLRYWSTQEYTRIALELDDFAPYRFEFLQRPARLYFDLFTAKLDGDLARGGNYEIGDPAVARLRVGMNRVNKARLVFDLNDDVIYDVDWLSNPPRLVIELRAKTLKRETLARAAEPEIEPEPVAIVAAAERELSRPAPADELTEEVAAPTEMAGRVAAQAPSFAEAFRALAGEGSPEVRAAVLSKSAPPPPKPQADAPKKRTATNPPSRSAAPLEVAPAVASDASVPGAEPPVTLAKLEPPPTSAAPAPRALHTPSDIPPPKPADEPSKGSQSLTRALGLKVGKVVIDAGHGGHDTGSIGPSGLREKDVVLDVSQRLAKLIKSRLGAEVLLTRDSDEFVDLNARTALANKAGADLFISVHANSFTNHAVRGVETYYLNFTTDPWALKVASRENAAASKTVHELQDLLSKIAMKEKVDESREFAQRMQGVLFNGLSTTTKGLKDRGVRQAPLMVLIGAKMPAILAEIGFLSNPTDEKLLQSSKYRQQVAEYLFEGIESYISSLSSHKVTMTEQERASASMD